MGERNVSVNPDAVSYLKLFIIFPLEILTMMTTYIIRNAQEYKTIFFNKDIDRQTDKVIFGICLCPAESSHKSLARY